MALRATFAPSSGSNVDISNRIRAYQASVTQYAEEGSTSITQIQVDDPEGGINILGLRTITLTETAESSNQQVIFRGFTTDRDITRGDSLRTGAARVWHVNMADPNSIISRRIMRGSDANRPAETDVARVQWLLGTSEFGGLVLSSRYVSTLYPVAMDAADYRDQSNQQILEDCSQASGKNFFVFYDEPMNQYGLFYDFPGSSSYRSSLRITNVLGFVDNDITFGVVDPDTKLNRDPSRVFSGVVLPFTGGEVYVTNATTATEFFARDTTAPSVNVKTTAKATARATRYLTDIRTEADVISTAIIVPIAKVNHIQVGHAVQALFAHFPGYSTGFNWMRVLTRTVTATSEEYYTIELELAAGVGGLADGSGLVPVFPPVPVVDAGGGAAQSCVALDGLHYDYTTFGTRSGLGPPVLDGGNWFYTGTEFMTYWSNSSSGISSYPTAGQYKNWGNGGVNNCVYTSGGVDYGAGGSNRWIRFTVVGPGTLSVVTAAAVGACANGGTIGMSAYVSGAATLVGSATGVPGSTLTVTIPNDGFCAHYVDLGGVANGEFGLVSATWSA